MAEILSLAGTPQQNGSGTSFADGSLYSFSADIGLYAQWMAPVENHKSHFTRMQRFRRRDRFSFMSAASLLTLSQTCSQHSFNAGHMFNRFGTLPPMGAYFIRKWRQALDLRPTFDVAQWSQAVPATIEITLNEGSAGSPSLSGLVGTQLPCRF